MKDHLVKATAEGVRVYAAVTTGLVNEGIRRHACYPVAAAALGRTMTGALLMAANLKNKECLTVKFNGAFEIASRTIFHIAGTAVVKLSEVVVNTAKVEGRGD